MEFVYLLTVIRPHGAFRTGVARCDSYHCLPGIGGIWKIRGRAPKSQRPPKLEPSKTWSLEAAQEPVPDTQIPEKNKNENA